MLSAGRRGAVVANEPVVARERVVERDPYV